MNELGYVVAYYLVKDKKLSTIKKELQNLNSRLGNSVKVWWTDNPKCDEKMLKMIFGETLQVRRDIFHILKDYWNDCSGIHSGNNSLRIFQNVFTPLTKKII